MDNNLSLRHSLFSIDLEMCYQVLDVVVDHRLRKHIKAIREIKQELISHGRESKHCDEITKLAKTLRENGRTGLSIGEVDFARYLAGPATQGGLVIALKKPAPDQNYDKTREEIVQKCATLRALHELSMFFGMRFEDISIFDAFTFITETIDGANHDHIQSHQAFCSMIMEKRPKVFMSAWTFSDKETNTDKLEPIGTGKLQKKHTGGSCELDKLDYNGHEMHMINMPHPSYYMNYHLDEGCMRQLQILEFAHACGKNWDIWVEELWMYKLRNYCRFRAGKIYDRKS